MQTSTGMSAGLVPPSMGEGIELVRVRSQNLTHESAAEHSEDRGLATDTITYPNLSRLETFTIISTVTGITILNSMQNGIVTVGLPTIGRDLGLNSSLILWYTIAQFY